jgi:hypothetical protein
MSDADEQLYGLMEIAERQQAAVQTALEGLAAERVELQHEREQLAEARQALAVSTRAAVRSAVEMGLAGASEAGVEAVGTATQPLLSRLEKMADGAGAAEAALRRVVLWASWRLLGWGVAAIASVGLLGWLASCAVLWWDAGAIGAMQARKTALEVEIGQLQATRDEWEKAGMLAKLERCNPGNRPCVRINEGAGTFGRDGGSDYRVLRGY